MALTLTTARLYAWYWFFATWSELRRETQGDALHPFWHTFAVNFIPIWGWLRSYIHLQRIHYLEARSDMKTDFHAIAATVILIGTSVVEWGTLFMVLVGTEIPFVLPLLLWAADGFVLAWAQSTLNAIWRALPGDSLPVRVHPLEWGALVVGTIFRVSEYLLRG
jgi:hypothetical protein